MKRPVANRPKPIEPHRGHRPARALAASLLALLLSACGGGIYLGWSSGVEDSPPSVALVASPTAALPGSPVALTADANDDYRVVRVSFYRLDDRGAALWLGDDYARPYRWDTVLPDSTLGRVRYIARAEDDVGQIRDSTPFDVTVLR